MRSKQGKKRAWGRQAISAADIQIVPPSQRTQRPFDLFFAFASANIVASTLMTGATLRQGLSLGAATWHIAVGSIAGALLVGLLAPVGSRWGVPSMIALRGPLGVPGAHLVATILFVTNFAWIALNNVVAASVAMPFFQGVDLRVVGVLLGLVATAFVLGGPRAVALANRAAVPLMFLAGFYLAFLAFSKMEHAGNSAMSAAVDVPSPISAWSAFDLVVAYQVSWILMFADFSRYQKSHRHSNLAVTLGLAVTSFLGMGLGATLATLAFRADPTSSIADPGTMLGAVGTPFLGAALIAAATVTTNFVNIYLSALALRSLVPQLGQVAAVLITGGIGAALALLSREWIDRYATFMGTLGMLLVPLGGVALAHFIPFPDSIDATELYSREGRFSRVNAAGLIAWGAGVFLYWKFQASGATLPALVVSFVLYKVLARKTQ